MIHSNKDNVLMPISILLRDHRYYVASYKAPCIYYTEPFFVDTISRKFNIETIMNQSKEKDQQFIRPLHFKEQDSRVQLTDVNDFVKEKRKSIILKKQFFIFHMSRCGSTLATQMLAANKRFFVISEPSIINFILDPSSNISSYCNIDLLVKASIEKIAECAPKESEVMVIKFRSWNVFFMERILKQFPFTPWIFIHRNGIEVLQSVLAKPPGWLRARIENSNYFASLFNLDERLLLVMREEEFVARMLGLFCELADQANNINGSYIDYENLKENLFLLLEIKLGIQFSEVEKQKMLKCASLNSKDISKRIPFQPDGMVKRNRATDFRTIVSELFVETKRKFLKKPFYI